MACTYRSGPGMDSSVVGLSRLTNRRSARVKKITCQAHTNRYIDAATRAPPVTPLLLRRSVLTRPAGFVRYGFVPEQQREQHQYGSGESGRIDPDLKPVVLAVDVEAIVIAPAAENPTSIPTP